MPRTKKAPKDKNAPKKPLSGYFIFSNERRPILRESNPTLKITDISKLIASEWKLLDESTKELYKSKSNQQKKDYTLAFNEYKQTDNYKKHQIKLNEFKQDQIENNNNNINNNNNKKKRKGKPKKPKKPESFPKSALTGYFIYQNDRREQLKNEGKELQTTEITKLVAKEWKSMNENDKLPYNERSKKQKENYQNLMQNYKNTNEYQDYIKEENEYKKKLKEWNNAGTQDNSDVENYNNNNGNVGNIGKVKLPKKPKDKNAPKKIGTAYLLFSNEKRNEIIESVKAKGDKVSMKEIQKQIGELWKGLNEEDRKIYQSRVEKLKDEYSEKMKEYENSAEYREYQEKIEEWKRVCANKKKEHQIKVNKLKMANKQQNNKKRRTQMDQDSSSDDSSDDDSDESSSEESSSSDSDDESSD